MSWPNREVARLTGHGGPVHRVTFSAGSGQYVLTGCSDRTTRLFNPAKAGLTVTHSAAPNPPGLIQSYSAHGYEVLDIDVTTDNARFASVGGDRQVFLWDVATAKTLRRWTGHGARVNCVGIGGDGGSVVASGGFDATVRLWDARSQSIKPIQILDEAKDSVSSLHIVEHEIAVGCVDGMVRLYDLRKGMVFVDCIGQPITSVCQSALSSTILVSALDATIRLMDKGSGKLLKSYTGHTNEKYRIRSCFGMGEAIAVSGSEDGMIYAWDILSGTVIESIDAHAGKVASAVAWNGSKKEWASAGVDGTAIVWGMSTTS